MKKVGVMAAYEALFSYDTLETYAHFLGYYAHNNGKPKIVHDKEKAGLYYEGSENLDFRIGSHASSFLGIIPHYKPLWGQLRIVLETDD